MSRRTTPPFRADHVGSLLRPPELRQARADHAAGTIDDDALKAVEDTAIADAIKLQRDVGLEDATDGEFRRGSWHMDFIYQLGGVETVQGDIRVRFRNDEGEIEYRPAAIAVNGKVSLDHTIFAEDYRFVSGLVQDGMNAKLTIPSPNMVHYRGGRAALNPEVYPEVEPFWEDLAAAYRHQIRGVAELGCTYLQLDDTSLAYLNDPRQREA